jgi:hypothetical protein
MSLSRRGFLQRLVRPGKKTPEQRRERYEVMAAYVRTNLLPYDFGVTPDQEAELFAAVRTELENTSDEELFSSVLRFKVEEVVDRKIQRWRAEGELKERLARLNEIRRSGVDYVGTFLKGQASATTIEQLQLRCGVTDSTALEAELRKQIHEWIAAVEDTELLQYDVVSIRDLVFAQLRSWC